MRVLKIRPLRISWVASGLSVIPLAIAGVGLPLTFSRRPFT